MNQSSKRFLFDLPGRYRIHVQGQLSMSWSEPVERHGDHNEATGKPAIGHDVDRRAERSSRADGRVERAV